MTPNQFAQFVAADFRYLNATTIQEQDEALAVMRNLPRITEQERNTLRKYHERQAAYLTRIALLHC